MRQEDEFGRQSTNREQKGSLLEPLERGSPQSHAEAQASRGMYIVENRQPFKLFTASDSDSNS